jgi:hypothetical protein
MEGFTKKEKTLLSRLNTPAKIQDFINSLPFNFEEGGKDTIKSPLLVLREKNAHCLEGAIFAAFALSLHGHKPLVLHLGTTDEDVDHCIAPYKIGKYWGAISKTNHNVLRYRDPVYKNIRELVMSYFHEYFLFNGTKTMRSYSDPLDLNKIKRGWEVSGKDLWVIDRALDRVKHRSVAPRGHLGKLRKADKVEVKGSMHEEYKKKKK